MSNIHTIDNPEQHDIRIIDSTAVSAAYTDALSTATEDSNSSQHIKSEPASVINYHVNAATMHQSHQHQDHHHLHQNQHQQHHQHQQLQHHQQQQQHQHSLHVQNQLQQHLYATTSTQPSSSAFFTYPVPLPPLSPTTLALSLTYSSRYQPQNLSVGPNTLIASSTSTSCIESDHTHAFSSSSALGLARALDHRGHHHVHDADTGVSDVPLPLLKPKVERVDKHSSSPLQQTTMNDTTSGSSGSGSSGRKSDLQLAVAVSAALSEVNNGCLIPPRAIAQSSSSPTASTSSHHHHHKQHHHHQAHNPQPSTSSGSGSAGWSAESMAVAQPSDELDSDEEELDQDEDADGEESSGSQSMDVSCEFERASLDKHVKEHVDKITAELDKLRLRNAKQHQQIKKLRLDNTHKGKEIDQIKDLNIKLQLELEKYRSSDAYNSSFTYCADREAKVTFPDGITLTAYNLKDLECCEIGEKGDSAFILKLLLALYTREELRMKSITGKPSRNKKYVQDTAEKFSPKKLQFIKEKFRERVSRENTLPTEREKRCRDERVHKIINTKIQNLKRKKSGF